MSSAGYSGTSLPKKLGLKDDHRVLLLHTPAGYPDWLGVKLTGRLCGPKEVPDFVHLFATDKTVFEKGMRTLAPLWKKNPQITIWVSWYKKSSGIATDLTEDLIRGFALGNGLVDIKVCAVTEEWSGLKLVVPLNKR
jgi:hypothetical protein